MVSVSERAWRRVRQVNYAGYDALAGWKDAMAQRYMPYTHNWAAIAGLRVAIIGLLDKGLTQTYERHSNVARFCRQRLRGMGVELWPARDEIAAPTVTAAKVPAGWTWPQLDQALRQQGMAVGGNYGPLAGKVFRIGHMGAQADQALVQQGMDVLEGVLRK
jgi:aspartate aminotransferase-like enzyme